MRLISRLSGIIGFFLLATFLSLFWTFYHARTRDYIVHLSEYSSRGFLDSESHKLLKNIEINHTDISSALLRPLRLRHCDQSWMSPDFAPCLKLLHPTKITFAEEIMYPSYRLSLPNFFNVSYRDRWVRLSNLTITEDATSNIKTFENLVSKLDGAREWIEFPVFRGQMIVFKNVKDAKLPLTRWEERGRFCMSSRNETRNQFLEKAGMSDEKLDVAFASVLIANNPDSGSFQHFLDHTTRILVQTEEYRLQNMLRHNNNQGDINHGMMTVTLPSNNRIVNLIWEVFGISAGRRLSNSELKDVVSAREVIYSCQAPRNAPYVDHRLYELLTSRIKQRSLRERRIILYFTRSNSRAANGGRRALNEHDFLASLQSLLDSRKKQERVIVFDENKFPTILELFEFFHNDVSAIVGVHGGAFYNRRFMPRDILVVEILPSSQFISIFWHDCLVLGQNYWSFVVDPESGSDVMIPINELLEVFRVELGKVPTATGFHLDK